MREYTFPTDLDRAQARAEAERRRSALVAAGCATYVLGVRAGLPRILCLCCGLGTHNSKDIKDRYCGFCQAYHREWGEGDDAQEEVDARKEIGY